MSTAILPAVIPEKKRPKIVPTSEAGFPYYPASIAVPASTPTFLQLEVISRQITIQNNTAGPIYRKYEGDVSVASFTIPAGGTLFDTIRSEVLFLFSPIATNVNPNQGQGAGIVVEVYP